MKISVQLTRDTDGEITIAIDSYTNRGGIEELVKFSIVGVYDAVAIFQSMLKLAKGLEDMTEEDKS